MFQLLITLFLPAGRQSPVSGQTSEQGNNRPTGVARSVPLSDVRLATDNFHERFLLGRGGFSAVYQATDPHSTQQWAVKKINRQGGSDFDTEVKTLSRIDHKHILRLLGFCRENGEDILIYELCSNGSLEDHLHPQPGQRVEPKHLSFAERFRIATEMACGVDYLHNGSNQPVLHRDLKPANILLDQNMQVKVADFGTIKLLDEVRAEFVTTLQVTYSEGYTDPWYHRTIKPTYKMDVYSLGMVLLVLLTGQTHKVTLGDDHLMHLPDWVNLHKRNGNMQNVLDPRLCEEVSNESLEDFVFRLANLGLMCTSDPDLRPEMRLVFIALVNMQKELETRGQSSAGVRPSPWFVVWNINADESEDETTVLLTV